jgi:hypothetical protein
LFARDELTNSVWAVERRVPDGLGAGRDGAAAGRSFRAALARLREIEPDDGTRPPAEGAPLRYVLGGTVAEHWIPFVPVHVPGDTRAIRLQRASMPRFHGDSAERIRPRTELLRLGVDADDVQQEPLFVNEEEVPRTGVVVETTFQRARWTGGETIVWQGRRRLPGAGESSSGLRFDVAERPRE